MKLKGNILPHTTLGITFRALGALLATRAMLQYDVLTFKEYTAEERLPHAVPGEHIFTMSTFGEEKDCGTIGCIGGFMGVLAGVGLKRHKLGLGGLVPRNLNRLFMPNEEYPACGDFGLITPAQAIEAIDNFLTTGASSWDKVLPKRKTKAAAKKPTIKKIVKKGLKNWRKSGARY